MDTKLESDKCLGKKKHKKTQAGQGEGLEVSVCRVGWYFQSSGGTLGLIEKMAFEQRLGGKGVWRKRTREQPLQRLRGRHVTGIFRNNKMDCVAEWREMDVPW